MGRVLGALLAALTALLAGCANIPVQSNPQAVGNVNQTPGAPNPPDSTLNPYDLVRAFVNEGGNPVSAKAYLTPTALQKWQGESPPTIISDTFGTTPITAQERKAQGDDGQGNEATVTLTVTRIGRLEQDRAFLPVVDPKPLEYTVVVRRDNAAAPWRIQTPPEDTVLVPLSKFNEAYQRINVFFWEPDFRFTVPDTRYITRFPMDGAPDRVMRLLLGGPSRLLADAVKSALPKDAAMRTNAVSDADGVLVVNLTKLGDQSPEQRGFIAAQVVLSLQDVLKTKVRLYADGQPLVSAHADWRKTDVPDYDADTRPSVGLKGMFVAPVGRVYSLADGNPIRGQAGSGEIKVQSAAQSIDGKSLAVVQEVPGGARLRVGAVEGVLRDVDLPPSTMTRPTWLVSGQSADANEVWTVLNGVDVVRVVRTGNDNWTPSPVLSQELRSFPGPITDLRLSRDGVRVAAVIGGKVVIGSVVRTKDSVSILSPRWLRPGELTTAVGVDWLKQDTVVVATGQAGQPVVNVPVDGFDMLAYNSSNLGTSIIAIAAAPDRPVLVTDSRGIWQTPDPRQVWRPGTQIAGALPFYPG